MVKFLGRYAMGEKKEKKDSEDLLKIGIGEYAFTIDISKVKKALFWEEGVQYSQAISAELLRSIAGKLDEWGVTPNALAKSVEEYSSELAHAVTVPEKTCTQFVENMLADMKFEPLGVKYEGQTVSELWNRDENRLKSFFKDIMKNMEGSTPVNPQAILQGKRIDKSVEAKKKKTPEKPKVATKSDALLTIQNRGQER